ncbi:hypothetical protein PMIN01_06656 [Paraphaeosphaeria minitans]|uniref:Uncharacterized protein n=1 Tax=Paraphaeosphaeria minitans TaxID=565426 RepID=A0A9P6KQW8_9PLEO|nr:hypothetical protein PMIN01_06656 [Paraphaeosphaeria minitans]
MPMLRRGSSPWTWMRCSDAAPIDIGPFTVGITNREARRILGGLRVARVQRVSRKIDPMGTYGANEQEQRNSGADQSLQGGRDEVQGDAVMPNWGAVRRARFSVRLWLDTQRAAAPAQERSKAASAGSCALLESFAIQHASLNQAAAASLAAPLSSCLPVFLPSYLPTFLSDTLFLSLPTPCSSRPPTPPSPPLADLLP